MKKIFLVWVLAVCSVAMTAQSKFAPTEVRIGDIFEIGKSQNNTYEHIKFPKDNFIVKRGGIVTYKNIEGSVVVVEAVTKKTDGTTIVKVKRQNGKRFFGSHTTVAVHYNEAVKSGELKVK